MDPKNLETAERFAKKRREFKEMYDLLAGYPSHAEVSVEVYINNVPKVAAIKSGTFNALMCKLIESEIKNIDEFVESL